MLSTDNWCIKVAQRVYGPYTMSQLNEFAQEGRLSATSLVAPAGGTTWRAARHFPAFNAMLHEAASPHKKSFGKNQGPGSSSYAEGALVNMVVIFDVVSGCASRLEHIIRKIGPAFRLTDNVWTVQTDLSVMGVRNELAPHLQVRECVFIIDAQRGRSAWQNFTPETHARLTKSWTSVGASTR